MRNAEVQGSLWSDKQEEHRNQSSTAEQRQVSNSRNGSFENRGKKIHNWLTCSLKFHQDLSISAAREKGPGKEQWLAADSSPSFCRALGITGKPQFLQLGSARWHLLCAICPFSCSIHTLCALLLAARVLSAKAASQGGLLPYSQVTEQQLPSRKQVFAATPTFISGFFHLPISSHPQHVIRKHHRSRETRSQWKI